MGYVPLRPSKVPPPPGNIPLYTHLLAHGVNPNGFTRCKNCGATDDHLNCTYCHQKKPEAYAGLGR